MDVNATLASQLYNRAQVAARPVAREASEGQPTPGEAFKAVTEDFMQTLRQGPVVE